MRVRRCRCGRLVEQGQECECRKRSTRLYNLRAWRGGTKPGLRDRFLAANPLCMQCLQQGRTTPAVDVDHVQPHDGDPDRFWAWENLQGLCKACHTAKTARGG